ncbi:aspartate aminotransferase family protein [Halospeciosus flavus]|uniref:Putative [LysW]-aminoadipate semialdehyde/glutamate semialdehyde transaminase n=1 Tax=Halospeciosus flavus TaxID=3032283 RepID=A0ABD5Z5J0_9EURY|nr:aspartate aminotransferase family protein [Halospeciosus flavus]
MAGFVFSEKPIGIESGEGVTLTANDGTEYLDFGASYACVPLGHRHPEVQAATQEQLAKLTFVQASYPVESRTRLYENLAEYSPGDLNEVWLCNSGTEANEAALKFARHATGDSKIVAMMRGFHGRTMGSLAATWKNEYREGFEPLAGDFEFVEYGDEDALEEAVDDDTAAVIMEPIQGEGGVNPAPPAFLRAARDVTEHHGAALVFDEVQTGLGRTGSLWASDQTDVVPDITTTAKGLGNGLPIAATLCKEWIAENAGNHGSTFSGGPVPCAAANATLDTLVEEDVPGNAAEMGEYLRDRLEAEIGDEVRDIRGEGLLVGVEVKRNANAILKDLALNHQILALPAGRTVVRFLPPLTIEEEHVEEVVEAMVATVGE